MSFKDKWNKTQPDNMAVKILESIKSQPPLKPRIEEAQKKLELQISKLDGISTKIVEKDQLIFKRIVHSIQNHDAQYAKLLSNELSQIRKMSKMVDSAKLALEQIQLRLNTITELGDVVVTQGHAGILVKDEHPKGYLSHNDKVMHTLWEPVKEEPIQSAMLYQKFHVVRFKRWNNANRGR